MKRSMRWMFAALMIVATPAMAADTAFDLICTPTKGGKAIIRYRVDLQAEAWCDGGCQRLQKLAGVSAAEIVLEEHRPAFARDRQSRTSIDRITGAWHTLDIDPRYAVAPLIRDGVCSREPFSGFPSAKF